MKFSKLPSLEYLNEALNYNPDTGVFTWKVRPIHHFKTTEKRTASHECKRWNKRHAGNIIKNVSSSKYISLIIDKKSYQASRVAYYMFHGYLPDLEVDHDNKNRSDNRIFNLRISTHGQNQANSGPYKNNKLGIKGVIKRPNSNKYRAKIKLNKKNINLGDFDCPAAASIAYQLAAIKYHGEFASL